MKSFYSDAGLSRCPGFLVAIPLALALPAAPAHAGGGDITNFSVRNCGAERMFVCSFDKTDSLMTIPYEAKGISPYEKKEFGCASLDKCKVIIGVSKKKSQKTLSSAMEAAISSGAVGAAAVSGIAGSMGAITESVAAVYILNATVTSGTLATTGAVTTMAVVSGVAAAIAVAAAGSVAALEIKDGWKDGDVCNEVRKAAQKAGMKPKSFMKNGKSYQVNERYAFDENGNLYLNPDGTAVFTYVTQQQKGQCPNVLNSQINFK